MENIAHTLAGGVMARAGLARTTRFATTALVLGSNLPDIDSVAGFGGPVRYLELHRGVTHSFAGSLVGGIALGLVLWGFDRWIVSRRKPDEDRARLAPLVALSLLACLVHMGFDFLNDYGLRPWLPFSDRWYYGDLVFIVDPWFWMILGGGLHLSMRRGAMREAAFWCGWALASLPVMKASEVPGATRVAWVVALLVLAALRWALIGARERRPSPIFADGELRDSEASHPVARTATGILQSRAPATGRRVFSRATPRASRSAEPPGAGSRVPSRLALVALAVYCLALFGLHGAALSRARTEAARRETGTPVRRLAATPRPADPLRWNVFYERGSEIVAASISALEPASPLDPASRPGAPPSPGSVGVAGALRSWRDPIVIPTNLGDPAVIEALGTPTGRVARGFCRYLVAARRETSEGPVVRFSDARFERRGRTNWVRFDVPIPSTGAR